MAKITPYQQGQMASSLVGTPGVNLSGASVLNYAGNELGQLGAAQHQSYLADLRAKQAEQRAMQKHMEDMARRTQVTNIASGAQVEQQSLMNDLQTKYRNDPAQAIKEYNDASMPKIQATLGQVSDPETNMMLQEKLMQQHASNLEKLGNWQRERQVPIAEQNLRDSAGSLAVTTGQMAGHTPAEVKATIDQYNANTHDQYDFYHPKGLSGQADASSNAVKEYLDATAAGGDPELLEKRIKEFSDGRYIAPSDLQSVIGQQRAIANNIASRKAAEQTIAHGAASMGLTRDLIDAGNGDPTQADPAVAKKIYEKYAPNLSPGQNVDAMNRIAGIATKQNEVDASEKALEMALTAPGNKTGKLENTPPDVIKEILKIPHLSPEDKEKYTKLLTGGVAATQSENVDRQLAGNIGRSAQGVMKLSEQIHTSIANIYKIRGAKQQMAAISKLQLDIDSYQKAYVDLINAHNTLKTKQPDSDFNALVKLHTDNTKAEFGDLIKILNFDKGAIQFKSNTENLYNSIKPNTIYQDQRQQQYYNYLHKQVFYNYVRNHNFTADDLQTIMSNPKFLHKFQGDIARDTAQWANQRGMKP